MFFRIARKQKELQFCKINKLLIPQKPSRRCLIVHQEWVSLSETKNRSWLMPNNETKKHLWYSWCFLIHYMTPFLETLLCSILLKPTQHLCYSLPCPYNPIPPSPPPPFQLSSQCQPWYYSSLSYLKKLCSLFLTEIMFKNIKEPIDDPVWPMEASVVLNILPVKLRIINKLNHVK